MNDSKFIAYYFHVRQIFVAMFLLFAWQMSSFAQPLDGQPPLLNQLKSSPSPYLAIHGNDPVAWQEWSPATIALARKQNKLLFVSIGYFSCHWCHVMQAESYRNADITALVNQNYIPVKYGARSTVVQTTCANGIKFVG